MPGSTTLRASAGSDIPAQSEESSAPSLFPTVPRHRDAGRQAPTPPESAAKLTGIARLAASSAQADAKRGTEYFILPTRSILNRCDSDRVPFTWTVNPYRGCEFGCHYCYARYTHEYMDLDGRDFERKIFVKDAAASLAASELRSKPVRGEHIAIGTATDPYQPAEREFRATRSILEKMSEMEGLSVSITTKSDQVVRDIDVLQRIAAHSEISVNLTVTTPRVRLARLLEPRAPRPDLRIAAIRTLREAGIRAGMFVSPILPCLTDESNDLELLARSAHDAGALWFAGNVLFLMPSSRKQFFPFIDERFPRLASRYHQWYERAGYAPEQYRNEISGRVECLRTKYGMKSRPEPALRASQAGAKQLTISFAPPAEG